MLVLIYRRGDRYSWIVYYKDNVWYYDVDWWLV